MTDDDAGGVRSIEVVARPATDLKALRDTVLREVREAFGLALDPSSVVLATLPSGEPAGPEPGEESLKESAQAPVEVAPEEVSEEAGPEVGIARAPSGNGRARIENVSVLSRDSIAEARVSLEYSGRSFSGVSEGPNTTRRRYQLIAEAALSGLEQILGESGLFAVEDLRIVEMADGPVVVVALELTSRRAGKRLSGACSAAAAHGSLEEATVRATLQAVNRLFSLFAGEEQQPA